MTEFLFREPSKGPHYSLRGERTEDFKSSDIVRRIAGPFLRREEVPCIEQVKFRVYHGTSDYGISNCHGTALYLVGEQERDRMVENTDPILKRFQRTEKILPGMLIAWPDNFVSGKTLHLGVILSVSGRSNGIYTVAERLTIAHRRGLNGSFCIEEHSHDKPIDITAFGAWEKNPTPRFYVPTALEAELATYFHANEKWRAEYALFNIPSK